MSSSTTHVSNGGVGFFGVLTIVFVVLKLTGVIDWSWWWVLSPLGISWAVGLAVVLVVLGVLAAAKIGESTGKRR